MSDTTAGITGEKNTGFVVCVLYVLRDLKVTFWLIYSTVVCVFKIAFVCVDLMFFQTHILKFMHRVLKNSYSKYSYVIRASNSQICILCTLRDGKMNVRNKIGRI